MSNIDTGLSPAEQAFMSSRGGSNLDQVLNENAGLDAERRRVAAEEGYTPVEGDGREQRQPTSPLEGEANVNQRADQQRREPDPGDEPGEPGSTHPKRVSWNRYQEAQEQIRAMETQRAQDAERWARADERIRMINEALAPDQDGERQDDDPEPDPMVDIFAHNAWLRRRLDGIAAQQQQVVQQTQQRFQNDALMQNYANDARNYAQQEPLFMEAYNWLWQERDRHLQIIHPKMPPQERAKIIHAEERGLVSAATQENRSPSAMIAQLAIQLGFNNWWPQEQQRRQTAQNGQGQANQAGQTRQPVLGGPQAQRGNGAARPAQNATEIIASIKAGQAASKSLSGGGGGRAPSTFGAQQLADMSDDEFAQVQHMMTMGTPAQKEHWRRLMSGLAG